MNEIDTDCQDVGKPPLGELLPHAEPMVLLSDYDPPRGDAEATAYVDVSPESPFFDVAAGGVPGCVALEYMAQTAALLMGWRRRREGLPPQIGFLLAARGLEVKIPFFRPGARYAVRVAVAYEDEQFGSSDATVADDGGNVVASAQLMACQTPEAAGTEVVG